MLRVVLGSLIFAATLILIITRSFRLTEAIISAGGGLLMLLCGIVAPGDAVSAPLSQWNIFGFFLGLMVIAAIADSAGIFDTLAQRAARLARGNSLRLYLAIFAVGALITAFLSNDATALILTPVVYALGTRLRLPALPFMFACTFIADTASFVLPVSNPINILILDALGGDLGAFLRYLALPALVCIALDIGLFTLIFRRSLGARYDVAAVAAPTFDRRFLRAVMGVLMVKEECGMRLLCAVGLSDGALVMREALALVRDSVEVIALYVIDEQPRRDAESPRGPLRHISPERRRELGQVEEEAGSA